MAANPFAAPAVPRLPSEATGSIWGMRSAFVVGEARVEVETSHWSGLEVYRVDGVEVKRTRNLGWHAVESFEAGGRTVVIRSRWYPFLPVVVEVEGRVLLEDLFPQLRTVKRALVLVFFPVAAGLGISIAFDLWRLWGLWG